MHSVDHRRSPPSSSSVNLVASVQSSCVASEMFSAATDQLAAPRAKSQTTGAKQGDGARRM